MSVRLQVLTVQNVMQFRLSSLVRLIMTPNFRFSNMQTKLRTIMFSRQEPEKNGNIMVMMTRTGTT